MQDLEAASVDDVRDFYRTYYVPANATLVLVGDFDSAQAHAAGQRSTSAACRRPTRPVPRDIPKEPPQTKERRVTLRGAVAAAGRRRRVSHHLRRPSRLVSAAHRVEGAVRRSELAHLPEAGLREAAGASRRSAARNLIEDPNLFYAVAIVQPGHTPEEVDRRAHRRARSAEGRADHRARAAAHEEPVRARLHPRPRVEPAEGAAAGARGR